MDHGRESRLNPWRIALVGACLASAATIVGLGRQLTFYNDDWYVLLQRPGLSAHSILLPHDGHLSAILVLIYKGLVAVAGLDSQLPFRLTEAAVVVSLALVVFLYVRRRLGEPPAVVAAAVLLFLGPAYEALLWTFEIGLMGSMVAGIGALLVLEREGVGRDRAGCSLLAVSLLFSNVGVVFVIAAAVEVLAVRRRPSQLWIAGLPALMFAVWWVAYAQGSPTHFSLGNVARAPGYVLNAMSSGLAAVTGLSWAPDSTADPLAWGRPLLALGAVGVAAWLLRGGRPSPRLAVIGAAALSWWLVIAFTFTPVFRNPTESRYLMLSGAFLLMLAAELFRSTRPSPATTAAIAAAGFVAIAANITPLKEGFHFFRDQTALARADLGALDLARRRVDPEFVIPNTPTLPGGRVLLGGVIASDYFRERDRYGSPADSPAQIATAPLDARDSADAVLGLAYKLALAPVGRSRTARDSRCTRLTPAPDASSREIELPRGGATIVNRGAAPATLGLRRFAPAGSLSVGLSELAGVMSARLAVPPDSSPVPWALGVAGGSPVLVCPLQQ